MRTLPKKTYQVRAMESGDTEKKPNRTESITTVTQNVVTLTAHRLVDSDCERAQNINSVQQGGSTVGVALNCAFNWVYM